MLCPRCGAQAEANHKFCQSCGMRLETIEDQSLPKNKRKKWIIPSVISLVAVSVLVVCIILFSQNSDVASFKKRVESRKYFEAVTIYEEMSAENRTKANTWIKKYISEIEDKCYNGILDCATALGILEEVLELDIAVEHIQTVGEGIYLDNMASIALERAKEYIANERWLEAYAALRSIHIKYRSYDEVIDLTSECLTNYKADVIEQIEAYGETGEIDKLVQIIDEALQVLPNDKQIVRLGEQQKDAFVKESLSNAETFAQNGNYQDAIEFLEYAYELYAHKDIYNAINAYSLLAAKSYCEALEIQGQYIDIIVYLRNLAYALDGENIYKDLQIEYANKLTEKALEAAASYAEKRQFQEAVRLLEDVCNECGNQELWDAIEDYKLYLPKNLSDCLIIEEEDALIGQEAYDCLGNYYENVITFEEWQDEDGHAIFYLAGRYVQLSGCFASHGKIHRYTEVSCKIYADGVLIYESGLLGRTSNPVTIDLDITGVQQLKIVCSWEASSFYYQYPYCILDLTVS